MERKGCVFELLPRQHQRDASARRESSSSSSSSSCSSVSAARYSDSLQMINSKISRHELSGCGDKKMAIIDMQFPWKSEFRRQCSTSMLSHGSSSLIKLITLFKRNVSLNVNDCYKKSSRAAKLKELIKEVLLLFVYFHRFEQPQDQNRGVYLEHMSDLLAMYIDLELVASKRDAEPQHGKISARLVSCLYVYLEKSTEHMLDTLIKVQLMNETHSQILDTVISKIFQMIPAKPETELMYVRYLLVYRLWKRVHSNLAVKKQINASALTSLGVCPDNLPATLFAQVLPAAAVPTNLTGLQITRFYLYQHFDLRKACNNFLQHCRESRGAEKLDSNTSASAAATAADDIIERDQRLKSTITSATNKIEFLNSVSRKQKSLKEKLDEIAFIDLTDEEVTKIVKRKKPRRISWLEDVKDVKRLASLKKERDNERKQKERDLEAIFEEEMKNASGRSSGKSASAEPPKSCTSNLNTDIRSESDNNGKQLTSSERIVDSVKPAAAAAAAALDPKTNPIPSPPSISSIPTPVVSCDRSDIIAKVDSSQPAIESSNSASSSSATWSKASLASEKREEKVSALRNADDSLKDNQPADSTVSNALQVDDEPSSSSGEKASANRSVIQEHPMYAVTVALADKDKSNGALEKQTVNFNSTKTDNHPNEQKVQQASSKKESRNLSSSVSERHPTPKKPRDKAHKNVNNEKVKAAKCAQAKNSEQLPSTTNGYYDIPESDIDGLTLLASVSAQQRVSGSSKKIEIKVKPYTSLQQKPKEEAAAAAAAEEEEEEDEEEEEEEDNHKTVASHIVGMYSEDCMDKVALQMEVSSSETVSSTVKQQQQQQQQPDTSSDLLSYIIDETIQNNLENANVILNGETVMLLQKSPNSNLYIINKAAVDNLSNSKLNYNSDDEDTATKLADYEDSKCCQQGILIKHDPDDMGQRGRIIIKPDPDYPDIKSNALIAHDDSKLQNQSGYELHYAGYPVPAPGGYCTYASIHHPSTGCPCVSCAYCRQLPFYLPATHATQSVQTTNSSVQEKRSKQKSDAAMIAKFYDEKMHGQGKDASLLDGGKKEQGSGGEASAKQLRYEHVDYYLPTAHAAPTVQINPAVQEKRSNKQADAAAVAAAANLYDDQLNSSLEKNSSDGQLNSEQVAEEKKKHQRGSALVSKFEQLGSTLPLKKRLKAQRMLTDFRNREVVLSLKNKAVLSVYPADVMVSEVAAADHSHGSPLDLGAVVEVTSAMAKPVKASRGRKEKTSSMNTKINNQNVPNCFPRKLGGNNNASSKKKRVGSTDEEVENSGVSVPKKSRKSSDPRAKQTRSSRRIVPTVTYVYPEIDTECNPSGKRRKKRSNRSS